MRLEPGQFFGEQGLATGKLRNAHVVAAEPVTCLVFSPRQPALFEGRGPDARLVNAALPVFAEERVGTATTRIECGEFLSDKLRALASYRSQFPMRPDMLPDNIFRDLFGAEYFLLVLPRAQFETEFGLLYDPEWAPKTTASLRPD